MLLGLNLKLPNLRSLGGYAGTDYTIGLPVRDGSGVDYTVASSVKTSDGTEYYPI